MSGTRARGTRTGPRRPLTGREAFETRPDQLPGETADSIRRETALTDADGLDLTEAVQGVFGNPDLYALAAAVPERSKTKPGCPAHYPAWALVGFGALISKVGSARAVHMHLRVPRNWQHVLDTVAETAGQDAVDALGPNARTRGPNRNHWNYWSRVNKTHAAHLEAVYAPRAVAQAQAQGLLDPLTPVNRACPDPRNTIYCDGKVMTGPVKKRKGVTFDPVTGEVLHNGRPFRHDPASSMWQEGGEKGTQEWGTKLVFTSVRGPGHFNKVNLGMTKLTKGGPSEVDAALGHVRRAAALAGDGVRALAYDGALRGVHINAMMRELGLVVASPVQAASNPNNIQSGKKDASRVEKERHYDTLRQRSHNGPCQHVLMCRGGRLGEVVTDSTGRSTWVPVPVDKLTREGNPGAYRFYLELTIPCPVNDDDEAGTKGSHSYRLPLVQTDEDTAKGFNRSEYLRQLPPDTKGYARTYGRRPPAESDNSQREARYLFGRLPAYGHDQQALIMLLGSLMENSTSRFLHRRRHPHEAQAA